MSVEQDKSVQNPTLDTTTPPAKAELPVPNDKISMPEDDDPDMRDLREAEAAVAAANKAGEAADPDKEPAKDPKPDAPPAGDQTPPAPVDLKSGQQLAKQPIMVPIERLNEALQQRDLAKEQLNYVKGIADARHEMAKNAPPAAPTTPVKSPQEVLKDISAAKINLAEKYDAGEITAVQWETHKVALEEAADQVREQMNNAAIEKVRQESTVKANQAVKESALQIQARELEEKHPYAKLINNEQYAVLNQIAGAKLLAQGIDPSANMMKFREELAKLTDTYGPMFTGKMLQASTQTAPGQANNPAPSAPSGSQQPAPSAAGAKLSELALARKNKLELAGQQPPDATAAGSQGGQPQEISDAQILKMTDDEIAVLPASVQQRVLAKAS